MEYRKKRPTEKIVNYLLDILVFVFGVILLIVIYTGIQTKVLGNDYNNFFGYSIFEVQTGSMEDTVNAGDWVIVRLTSKVKLNDIITYKLGNEYITHRVVEVYNGTYITKGDANSAKDDKPIDQKQVVGKVVKVLSHLGIIRKTIFNVSVLIAIFITLFLFNLALRKNRYDSNKKRPTGFDRLTTVYPAFKKFISRISLFFENILGFINKKSRKKNYMSKLEDRIITNFDRQYDFDKLKNDEVIEDELGKTAIYRVISVDADEVDDKYRDQQAEEINNEKQVEDELEKTAVFRVVSVDADEVDDKYKEQTSDELKQAKGEKVKQEKAINTSSSKTVSPEEIDNKDESEELTTITNNEEALEDELSKTSVYRVIPVDASELDDTLIEIAKNEIKESGQSDENKQALVDAETKLDITDNDEEDSSLTKINLDLLKGNKSGDKDNNIINTAMFIKKSELNGLINILLSDNKKYANKATIKNAFIKNYINIKYYNLSDDKDIKYNTKNRSPKIKKVIKDVESKLINNYKGPDSKYNDIVGVYAKLFILIATLEQARDSISDLKVKREFYKKEIAKYIKDGDTNIVAYVVEKIIKIQENYANTFEFFFQKFETNMFDLSINKLTTKKNMYGLDLKHNISFSKVYSDYIINKTYNEGIVAEDKITVLLTLLSIQLIKDMMSSNFGRKYIIYIPSTLYKKERKLNKLLRMIDDDYAKDNVVILLTYEDLLNNKQLLKRIRKMGYKFALSFSKDTVIKGKAFSHLYIVNYIFINKKDDNMANIISFIPEELSNIIIYEDIVEKVGDLGVSN